MMVVRDQHVGVAAQEVQHHLLQLLLGHLAVRHGNRAAGASSRSRSAALSMVSTRLCR